MLLSVRVLLLAFTYAAAESMSVRSVIMSSPPTAAEAAAAAKILQCDGVVWLRCNSLEAFAPPADNAMGILAGMFERMKRAGLDSDQRFSFAEICHRSPRRYDVHLGDGRSTSAFSMLFNELVKPVLALLVVGSAEITILRDGLVTSLPGASAQPFHADGHAYGLFNAFLPLGEVSTGARGSDRT